MKRLYKKSDKDPVTIAHEFVEAMGADKTRMAFDPTYASKFYSKLIPWLEKHYPSQLSQPLIHTVWNALCGVNGWAAMFPATNEKTDKDYNYSNRPGPFL